MSNRSLLAFAVMFAIAATVLSGQSLAEVLKREPPMGQLQEGQVVLVDDGSCPAGQIKQVTGGNHVKAGGFKHIERTRNCIPR
jgi:hypothetical protein